MQCPEHIPNVETAKMSINRRMGIWGIPMPRDSVIKWMKIDLKHSAPWMDVGDPC